jgi:hypothetical protein
MTEYLEPEEYDERLQDEQLVNLRFTTDCPDNPVILAIVEAMRQAHKEHPPKYRTCRCVGPITASDFAYPTEADKKAVRAAMDVVRDREMPKDPSLHFNALGSVARLMIDTSSEACACPFKQDNDEA